MTAPPHLIGSERSTGASISETDFEQLRLRLERAVAKICPAWLACQAEDLVQVAMLRLLDRVGAHNGQRVFNGSYLYRVAYSALVDEIRRHRARREVALEDDEGRPLALETPALGPEASHAGRELGDAIAACLRRLIRSRRRATLLHLYGHPAAEVAAILDHSLKQARNLIFRGVSDLRLCLTRKGYAP